MRESGTEKVSAETRAALQELSIPYLQHYLSFLASECFGLNAEICWVWDPSLSSSRRVSRPLGYRTVSISVQF